MEQNKVDLFITTHAEYFPQENLPFIREKLLQLPDESYANISMIEYKNPLIILIFSLTLGTFGVDRFMLGQTVLGIVKLLTLGGCGIWALIDFFLIIGATKETNLNTLMNYITISSQRTPNQNTY